MTSEMWNQPGTPFGDAKHNPSQMWDATEECCSSFTFLETLVALGVLAGELVLDGGTSFGMRFLPCLSVWPFVAQWRVGLT